MKLLVVFALLGSALLVACEESGVDNDSSGSPTAATTEVSGDAPEATPSADGAPENAATEAPTATPTATEEPADMGTRENPVPLGEAASVGDWSVRVVSTIPDATDAVMQENQFNDPPAEGRQFFIVAIEATYEGDETGTFWIDMMTEVLDESNVVYSGMDNYCGVIPDSISDVGEAFPGGVVSGNDCWSVQTEYADSLVMFVEESFSFDGERVFFALQ